MKKRGRPRQDPLDRLTEDAAIRWRVVREVTSGIIVKVAQKRVSKSEGISLRHVRTAYERFGQIEPPKTPKKREKTTDPDKLISAEERASADADWKAAKAVANEKNLHVVRKRDR